MQLQQAVNLIQAGFEETLVGINTLIKERDEARAELAKLKAEIETSNMDKVNPE